MKKVLAVFCTAIILLMSSCPGTGGGTTYPTNMLGEWIRMDTGERWYITGNTITVDGVAMNRSVTLSKTSEQVITVKESGRADYFLFASRVADASFRAQVVFIGDENSVGFNISRDLVGGSGQRPPVKITNPQQPELPPITATPDPVTGEIIVDGIIPGDPVVMVPDDSSWNNVRVEVTPWADGQNMGIIPLAHGVNLKATIRLADSSMDITELYADDQPRSYVIEIENIGTDPCYGADYQISWNEEDFEFVSGSQSALVNTIVPGAKIQVPLTLASKPITGGSKNKQINVTVTSYDTEAQTIVQWVDTVSMNYYKEPVAFRFKSDKPVQGVIRTPQNKTYYFRTAGTEGDCGYSINLPWSAQNYIVTFLGASVETQTETGYSLAINAMPPTNWESLQSAAKRFENEPGNDSVAGSQILTLENNSVMGYLITGDIDYYRINLGATGNAGSEYYSVSFNSNGGSGVPTQTVFLGDMANSPTSPVRSSYSFAGWYSDPSLSFQYDFNTLVLANITLYAKWASTVSSFTVAFNSNGGNSVPTQTVNSGGTANQPADPTRDGYTFAGWYSNSGLTTAYNFSNSVTANITLYAKWEALPGLAAALLRLQSEAVSGGNYLIEVDANETIAPQTLSYSGRDNITITLRGVGAERIISLASNGAMFAIYSGVTLVLDDNITLQGRNDNDRSLIQVGGKLIMKDGSKITDNTYSSLGSGGGVLVSGGTFTMESGKISGNTVTVGVGGGVYVSGGTFTMSGGEISGNTASNGGGGVSLMGTFTTFTTFTMTGGTITDNSSGYGGMIDVWGGTFTMNGGEISGNTAPSSGAVYLSGAEYFRETTTFIMNSGTISDNSSRGVYVGETTTFIMNGGTISTNSSGGVYVNGTNASFTMSGGEISGNTAPSDSSLSYYSSGGVQVMNNGTFTMNGGIISTNSSGGVHVDSGTFTMSGGEISDNTATSYGGGVYVGRSGTFSMEDGEISGNTANLGGGVYVVIYGTFTMSGGKISGNTATSSGGGVYVYSGTFTMSGGEISGNTASSSSPYGGGVYVDEGTFTKTGNSTITSYADDPENGNVVKNSSVVQNNRGHAVYVRHYMLKDTTAGPGVDLSFDYNGGSPTWSGEWDY